LTFTATFDPAIDTPYGRRPGFDVVGTSSDGIVVVDSDYVPAIGWYSLFEYFDPASGELQMRVRSMGYGEGWQGTYYIDEARHLLASDDAVGVSEDGSASTEWQPQAAFTVSGDATYLVGYYYCWAFSGVWQTFLLDPENTRYECPAHAAPLSAAGDGAFLDIDAIAGQWRWASLGAGVAAGGGIEMWEVVEHAFQLGTGATAIAES
jgi:hypothetical protein